MYRVPGTAVRPRIARFVAIALFAAGVLEYVACSDDPARYQILKEDRPAAGNVVAGRVEDGGDTAVKGAVVAIE